MQLEQEMKQLQEDLSKRYFQEKKNHNKKEKKITVRGNFWL